MANEKLRRRLPVGAEVVPGGVHFRVWASRRRRVEVVIESERGGSLAVELKAEAEGYFSALVRDIGGGALYRYSPDGEGPYPDPASRFQPKGPHGPSKVIDVSGFRWTDDDWKGVNIEGQVIYEMHVGTFTREGTWEAAGRQLPELASAGITLIEMMPVCEFAGRFGWGYDGVDLFAPTHLYGEPDDLKRFVDLAHSHGIGVILDVVYNHLGPDGCYLSQFSEDYFTKKYHTDWGSAINFDDAGSGPVREFFIANAGYWIDEFHMDGLRLDATQDMHDESPDHILSAITRRVREAGGARSTVIVAENEPQHTSLVRPIDEDGHGMDALWNDDFHHSAVVALTGRNEAYYTDYLGAPQEFISAVKYGYLYQGQRYEWQKKRRGTPAFGLKPANFVTFIENHDQLANSARGQRLRQMTSPALYRVMTGLVLLGPGTPMLFQGQEFGASSPFLYFADHKNSLTESIRKGRREFLAQFPSIALEQMQAQLADPDDLATFERSKLDLSERERNGEIYHLHKDLLRLRREDAVFKRQGAGGIDGAVLGADAFVLRFFGEAGDDRLLVMNLGRDLHLTPAPEPLLAPPGGMEWEILWSSEHPRYGGNGAMSLEEGGGWRIPGRAMAALIPKPLTDLEDMEEEDE